MKKRSTMAELRAQLRKETRRVFGPDADRYEDGGATVFPSNPRTRGDRMPALARSSVGVWSVEVWAPSARKAATALLLCLRSLPTRKQVKRG